MTASEILTALLEAMPDSYQKTVGFPAYDILAAAAERLSETDEAVAAAAEKLDPETLTGSELDRFIMPRTGLERRAGTFAHGLLRVVGTGTVPRGALFESDGGVRFYATEEVEVTESGDVPVSCLTSGTAGNLPADSVTQFPVTIQGILTCTNPAPMTGGFDTETDAEYYARHLIKLRTPPTSGNVYHYQSWALEVAGVGAPVKVFPLAQGANTVDVVLIDSAGQPAGADVVAAVQEYIDPDSTGEGNGEAPIGARCYVSAATAKPLTISATVRRSALTDEETVSANIRAAITGFLSALAFREDYVSYARLTDAILHAEGVVDITALTLDGGTVSVSVAAREVATVGEVTITYAA